jgi:hypothetical protein
MVTSQLTMMNAPAKGAARIAHPVTGRSSDKDDAPHHHGGIAVSEIADLDHRRRAEQFGSEQVGVVISAELSVSCLQGKVQHFR